MDAGSKVGGLDAGVDLFLRWPRPGLKAEPEC